MQQEIPYGYCHCGCGKKTNLMPWNSRNQGMVKDQPYKYVVGHQPIPIRSSVEGFWSKVDKKGEDDCWEWTAQRMKTERFGYGRVMFQKKRYLTHRLAWILTYGEIPKGLFVLHKCDNPPCCNPNHLFLGTHDDNMNDMAVKGRVKLAVAPYPRKRVPSETRDEIARLYFDKGTSKLSIAKQFGINRSTVANIIGSCEKRNPLRLDTFDTTGP